MTARAEQLQILFLRNKLLGPDKLLFVGLLFLVFQVFFYRGQAYLYILFSPISRLIVFGFIFFCILKVTKKLQQLTPLYLVLFSLLFLIGVHTALRSGTDLAFHATGRFANVMMLGPLAAAVVANAKELGHVFRLLGLIAVCAYATLLYQYLGGSLSTLVGNYIAIRADLIRYMTLVGEPNVGGMLAVLVFCISTLLIRSRSIAVILAGFAFTWVVFSISKAALIGFLLCCVLCILLEAQKRQEIFTRIMLSCMVGALLLFLIGGLDYGKASINSLIGNIKGDASLLNDFEDRQGKLASGIGGIMSNSLFPSPYNYIFGASFSEVGSAAQELRGVDAVVVLPHNSYLELFLTGGVALLGVTLLLILRALAALASSLRARFDPIEICALVCLLLLVAWMFVYPVIYEPITGCMFWVLVGYGNRSRVNDNQSIQLPELKGGKN